MGTRLNVLWLASTSMVLAAVGLAGGCTLDFDGFRYPPDGGTGAAGGSASSGGGNTTASGGSGSSSGGAGGMSSGQGGTGGSGQGGGGGAVICGENPDPTQMGCPAACDDCDNNICTIDCSGEAACKGETVQCPEGMPCEVLCDGKDACQDTVLQCSPAHACELTCQGEKGCDKLQMTCGAGTCTLICGGGGPDVCLETQVSCGANSCVAACTGMPQPTLDCGNSCDCQPC